MVFHHTVPASGVTSIGTIVDAGGVGISFLRLSGSGTMFGMYATDQGAITYCKGVSTLPLTAATCALAKW